MANDPFNDDFFNKNSRFQFDNDLHSSSFDESFKHHNEEFDKSFAAAEKVFFIFFGLVVTFIVGGFVLAIFLICIRICKGESYRSYRRNRRGQTIIPPPPPGSSPVVVTTTTIPGPTPAGYPPQNTTLQGYPMPQPQPGFVAQPYPNQAMPPYPMPQPQPQVQQADFNPPSYDQVMRGGEAYQKQAPYNPNYTGQ